MSERHLLNSGVGSYSYLERDHSDPKDIYRVMHQERPDATVEKNKRVRSSELVKKGDRAKLGEGGVIISSFSIPQHKYFGLSETNPREWEMIHSADHDEVVKGWERLQVQYPQWKTSV